MTIDIIMPHYNGLFLLDDALKSLSLAILPDKNCNTDNESISQSISFHLILVLDNNIGKEYRLYPRTSFYTDEEYRRKISELISKYKIDAEIICPEEKMNVAKLRNTGISSSCGDYIYFMDSDDYLLPHSLYHMASEAISSGLNMITGPIIKSNFKYDTTVNDKLEINETDLKDNLCNFNFSALHLLIKRNSCGDLLFDETNELYPDVPFTAKLLSTNIDYTSCKNAVYVKRTRNDSVRYPALNQLKRPGRDDMLKELYKQLEKDYNNLPFISSCIDRIRTSNKTHKRLNYVKKIKAFINRPVFMYRMIEKFFFRRLPMKDNWVVFESFRGKGYSDSCKYIYEYMRKVKGDKYRYIWVVNNKKTTIPGNVTKVRYLSPAWFYYTGRARYYVNNVRQPAWMNKRKGATHLETWHGTPLKKLVFDMDDVHSATPTHKQDVYDQSRNWDYLISDNPFSTNAFESCFLYPRERILETGYPRNDILYDRDRTAKAAAIKEKLGIPAEKKVILYAPTWRDDEYYKPGEYQFALKLDLDRMRRELGNEYIILLRTHYYIADSIDITGIEDFAYDVSRYDDIAELYLISDICITDYSSVFFDYANLKRPILFYVYDFGKYKDRLRGFYIDMEKELPGPLLYTEDEVITAIKDINRINATYKEKYNEFYNRFCSVDDGFAAKRIVDKVFHI